MTHPRHCAASQRVPLRTCPLVRLRPRYTRPKCPLPSGASSKNPLDSAIRYSGARAFRAAAAGSTRGIRRKVNTLDHKAAACSRQSRLRRSTGPFPASSNTPPLLLLHQSSPDTSASKTSPPAASSDGDTCVSSTSTKSAGKPKCAQVSGPAACAGRSAALCRPPAQHGGGRTIRQRVCRVAGAGEGQV